MAGAAAVDVPAPAAANGGACCHAAKGPGYATPLEAMEKGPREKLIYVTCVYNGELVSCVTPSVVLQQAMNGRIMEILTYYTSLITIQADLGGLIGFYSTSNRALAVLKYGLLGWKGRKRPFKINLKLSQDKEIFCTSGPVYVFII